MTITKEDLLQCHVREAFHATGDGFYLYGYVCGEHPRLSRIDTYKKKDRSFKSVWSVDGEKVADFDAAIAALNVPVIVTDEERALLEEVPIEWTRYDEGRTERLKRWRVLTAKGLVEWDRGRVRRRLQT